MEGVRNREGKEGTDVERVRDREGKEGTDVERVRDRGRRAQMWRV